MSASTRSPDRSHSRQSGGSGQGRHPPVVPADIPYSWLPKGGGAGHGPPRGPAERLLQHEQQWNRPEDCSGEGEGSGGAALAGSGDSWLPLVCDRGPGERSRPLGKFGERPRDLECSWGVRPFRSFLLELRSRELREKVEPSSTHSLRPPGNLSLRGGWLFLCSRLAGV